MPGAVPFTQIPNDLLVPGQYAEISNEKAGYFVDSNRAMIVGQGIGTITDETPKLVASADWVKKTYGAGSQLAIMVDAFRLNNNFQELWILPLQDAASATKASCTITVAGTATSSGTIVLYVGGYRILVPVSASQAATTIASSIATYVNLTADDPVTAAAVGAVVTLTAKNAGTVGNSIKVVASYFGTEEGEYVPSGVTLTITAMSGGATDPNLAVKLANIGNMDVGYYAHPYSDTASLNAFRDFLSIRWDALSGNLDGIAFTAKSDTFSGLQSLGTGRNDENHVVIGYESTHLAWAPMFVGAYVGIASFQLNNDPSRGLQTLILRGIPGIKQADRFSFSNRATLLNTGIATIEYTLSNQVKIERAITTYQSNLSGIEDRSYLDVMTRTSLSYFRRSLVAFLSRFARHKLAASETAFGAGRNIVTVRSMKNELTGWYKGMIERGVCQNEAVFNAGTRVTTNPDDPNRLDIIVAPTLINNLMVTAVKIEFRLQS